MAKLLDIPRRRVEMRDTRGITLIALIITIIVLVILADIVNKSIKYDVTKIMPIALNEEDQNRVTNLFEGMNTGLTLSWGIHPVANPLKFGIITATGISKKQGAIEIANNMNVPLENILAVGDSTSDWQFIELCGYGAAMGNTSRKLKEYVKTKQEGHSYIGGDVDENGIIEILNYFEEAIEMYPI